MAVKTSLREHGNFPQIPAKNTTEGTKEIELLQAQFKIAPEELRESFCLLLDLVAGVPQYGLERLNGYSKRLASKVVSPYAGDFSADQ